MNHLKFNEDKIASNFYSTQQNVKEESNIVLKTNENRTTTNVNIYMYIHITIDLNMYSECYFS